MKDQEKDTEDEVDFIYRKLNGWDDGGITFITEDGKEYSVHCYPELALKIIEVCEEYFRSVQS